MRIEQLEYLAAVTLHGSLRRASEQLHISQPALSEALSKLERELGVTLLDRRRSGARISRTGQELLHNMQEVLDAVERLKLAANDQHTITRTVRIGTVNAGTSSLLVPALRAFQEANPHTMIELLNEQQAEIHQSLIEGSLDLGLINVLDTDEPLLNLVATNLQTGRPVVVLPTGHPLAAQETVTVADLRAERFVAMRAGYLMHRYAQQLFDGELPQICHTADGAEMGKLMVAEGLGVSLLPDYSVAGDPLERTGLITSRPIADDPTRVSLLLLHRRTGHLSRGVRAMYDALVTRRS